LAPDGWQKSDEGNYSIIMNPSATLAIVVSTGDEATGLPHRSPRTKCPKGPATAAAIRANRSQLDFFQEAEPFPIKPESDKGPLTWVLLVRDTGSEIYAELSLPLVIGDDDRIEYWRERIILPKLTEDGDDDTRKRGPDSGPDIEVAVVRRVS
jgi:hypothetical protein